MCYINSINSIKNFNPRRWVYRNPNVPAGPTGIEAPGQREYAKERDALLKDIGGFASEFEREAGKGEYYRFGNLGDGWLMGLEELVNLHMKTHPNRTMNAEDYRRLKREVGRLEKYVGHQKLRDDIDSHLAVSRLKASLERLVPREEYAGVLFKSIDGFASEFEREAGKGEYYGFGNLADGWIPDLEELVRLTKGASLDFKLAERVGGAVVRFKNYVEKMQEPDPRVRSSLEKMEAELGIHAGLASMSKEQRQFN